MVLALGLLVLATILRGIVWSGLLPAWQGPDETSHYAFVERLATWSYPNRTIPPTTLPPRSTPRSSTRPSSTSCCTIPAGRSLRRCGGSFPPEAPGLSQDAPSSLTTNGYPPLYYALLVPLYRLPGLNTATSRLHAVRLGSALIAGLLVVLTFFLVRELVPDDTLALAGAGLVTLPPIVSQASGICNPDIGLAAACPALALASLRLATRGLTVRRFIAVAALSESPPR